MSGEQNEIEAAAERMRQHEAANFYCGMKRESPYWRPDSMIAAGRGYYCRQLEVDRRSLAQWAVTRLAAERAEREERERPIGVKWLKSIGFEFYEPDGCMLLDDSPSVMALLVQGDNEVCDWQVQDCLIPEPKSRGQLLDLLALLGVKQKGASP